MIPSVFCSGCIGCCSSNPDNGISKTSSKPSNSCKLPVHLDSTDLAKTAHKSEMEARFKANGGLVSGMDDAKEIFGGYATREEQLNHDLNHELDHHNLAYDSEFHNSHDSNYISNHMENALNRQVRNEIASQQMHNALTMQQNHNELASKQLQETLSLISGHEDLTASQIQEAMKQEEFKNDQNFENLKHFQNYKETFNSNELEEDDKSSFSMGSELKITNLSTTSKIENYVKVFSSSKIFLIKTNQNSTVYINLISTTRYYHPQFRIYEKKDGKFYLMQNINFLNKYFFSDKGYYVLEVGTGNTIDTEPYPNMKTGDFEVIISSEIRTIAEILNDEGIKVQIWGFEGMVPFIQNSELVLYHDSWKHISYGILNYQITPFYDTDRRTLNVYYHKGSSQYTGHKLRSSTVEIKCNRHLFSPKVYYGTEPRPAVYHFDVESRRICDLYNLIE